MYIQDPDEIDLNYLLYHHSFGLVIIIAVFIVTVIFLAPHFFPNLVCNYISA
jgi:hypothetical protein